MASTLDWAFNGNCKHLKYTDYENIKCNDKQIYPMHINVILDINSSFVRR